jgi:very-short-patch-repair endonuclease
MAAVLAGGPGAVLSHRSAANLWGIHSSSGHGIDVTVSDQRRGRRGIEFHRASLPKDEVGAKNGIAVTSVPRTLFDLAALLRPRQLGRAINEAEVLRLWDELSLEHLLTRYPGRAGSRAVRTALQRRKARAKLTRSDLEVAFLEFVDETGLLEPETNVLVEGYLVDAVWREQRLVVELDGEGFHSSSEAFERDRERDRVLQAAGWRIVRITWKQLELTRRRLEAGLRTMLGAATLTA